MSALTVPTAVELIAPETWRTVDFFSDLHLQAAEPATVQALHTYLHTTPADALFILGDLFEVWVGDDVLEQPHSFESQCCAVLAQTATRHQALYFVHGNRDFLAGSGFAQASGATILADPTVLQFAGQRYMLSHGDALCLADVEYQGFRALTRSAAWQQHFLAQPLTQRRAQARNIRTHSSARKKSTAHAVMVYADVDHDTARMWLQAAQTQTLIHGHTHRPAHHFLSDQHQRYVLSDWDWHAQPARADVLRLTHAGLQRIDLTHA